LNWHFFVVGGLPQSQCSSQFAAGLTLLRFLAGTEMAIHRTRKFPQIKSVEEVVWVFSF
jgi:hypothetical protein